MIDCIYSPEPFLIRMIGVYVFTPSKFLFLPILDVMINPKNTRCKAEETIKCFSHNWLRLHRTKSSGYQMEGGKGTESFAHVERDITAI